VPETARRLADPVFTKNLYIHRAGVVDFAEKQREFLLEVLTGLDAHNKAGLALIFMRNGALESPVKLGPSESEALERLGSALGPCTTSLGAMQGSLTRYTLSDGVGAWQFKHPTIGDAFAEFLLQNPDLLGIYLGGTSFHKLLSQVTCGDLGFENAVVVPRSLFPVILRRLDEAPSEPKNPSGWDGEALLDFFLARRCGRDFLESYIAANPEILNRITNPWISISAQTGVPVVLRLFELGLLSEDLRRKFLETVTEHAFEYGDPEAFTNERIRGMFRAEEWQTLLLRVRADLSSFLERSRYGYQENCSSRDDPEEWIRPFFELCDELETQFQGDSVYPPLIQHQRNRAKSWVESELSERPPEPDSVRELGVTGSLRDLMASRAKRSIFDDVDN
jgi:hypothetical protein